jgi:hypothetical protein
MWIEGTMADYRGQHGIPNIHDEELEEDKGDIGK